MTNCVPTSDNYTVLNYYQHFYHSHHMAILQPSALSSAIPTNRNLGECFFWYRLTRVVPDTFHRAVKQLCVCVCVCVCGFCLG